MGEVGAGRGVWAREGHLSDLSLGAYPWRTCFQGDHDLCGYRRPQSYFRDAVWRGDVAPRIFTTHPEHFGEAYSGSGWHWDDVHETWTFEDRYLGKPVKCDVYTDADEIVFVLNGREVAKAVPEGCIATAVLPYERGTLTAQAIRGGKVVGTHTLETTTGAARIELTPEQTSIRADRRDLAYFRITVTDNEGRHVPEYAGKLTCSVTGGELMGIYSGDPCNEDEYGSSSCHAFEGHALAVVRTPYASTVTVTVFAEGLAGASASVKALS
jgi:beta-galactosidase